MRKPSVFALMPLCVVLFGCGELETRGSETVDAGQPVAQSEDVSARVDSAPEAPQPERYLGGWAKADCADEITGTGNKVGDIAMDFSQMDQFGEMLRLYDFCDRYVLLIGSAFW